MARKKKILVEDILELIEETDEVVISFYAYGVYYANSWNDGLKTAKDCREGLRYECLRSQVGRVKSKDGKLHIGAELVH